MIDARPTRRWTPNIPSSRLCATLLLAATALLASACGGQRVDTRRETTYFPASADIENSLLVDPSRAREIGYRVDWQYPVAGPNLKILTVQGDSVFTMDENNYLTRIDREDGTRVWRIPISYPLAEIQGITYMPSIRRVLVNSGGDLFVLNASDGSQIERQKLLKIANTESVPFGDYIIYGSRNGQLIWHSHKVAVEHSGYQIARSIKITPEYRNGLIVVIGNDGEIAAIDASSATKHWDKKLLERIVAAPTIGRGAVFVSGLDQSIWAIDIGSGRIIWRYLSESPLTDSPVLIDDQLYQQVAAEGLICFEALPFDKPRGQIIWSNPDISGTVLTQRRENLICWDAEKREFQVITSIRGGHVTTLHLPGLDKITCTDNVDGEIYASNKGGRVIRLVPRN
ncbi:MAG: PQQ-binding-like beta-propeller repeat protein [Planctomycetota bacterium]|nr:PQQ-binding-like beta-propeller repeat protein [Planctomycetota bacterium]